MKIVGLEGTLLRTRDFALRSDPPLTVRLTALPLGFLEKLRMKMPAPVPPTVTLKSMTPKGTETVMVRDESDSAQANEYRRKDVEDDLAVTAAIVREGLRNDENVTWTAQIDAHKGDWRACYLATYEELVQVGFTGGEVSRLSKAIAELTSLDDEGLAKATGFLLVDSPAH